MAEQAILAGQIKPSVVPPSSSFRLRSKSLNSVRLRRVFDLFDKNGDEYITIAELADALARLGLTTNPSELELTVSGFIQPGAIGLDFNDFQNLHRTLGDALFGPDPINPSENNTEEADMQEAFNVFDEDGDGFISAQELKTVLEKLGLGEGQSMDRVQLMICSVDKDSDGRVDFGEFKNMMKSIDVESS
ncbi:EF hand calcium-binding protein family [Rhynchospora pubera]|uniref:EF hand calcium-binding protein family n=1 Tax=Rhynchospora pubera TaxID=906938 RepID=A0AAV8E0I0_9POAL|nr:EF hand calcium-binding protein family [Rhynchospora pubera]